MKSPSQKSVEVEVSRIIASFPSRSNRKVIMVDSAALQGALKKVKVTSNGQPLIRTFNQHELF